MERRDSTGLIAEKLAGLAAKAWSGEVWRHTFADNPPDRRNVRGARWNPSGVEALYMSLAPETALAEAEHLIEAQPLRPTAKRTLHRLHIELGAVVDLTGDGLLASLGVDDAALTTDDVRACQAVGGAAALLGLDGMIVPSARAPGGNIVILFGRPNQRPEIKILDSAIL